MSTGDPRRGIFINTEEHMHDNYENAIATIRSSLSAPAIFEVAPSYDLITKVDIETILGRIEELEEKLSELEVQLDELRCNLKD